MANPNVRFSDVWAILDSVSPSSQAAGAATTGWIDASQYQQFAGVVQSGVLGTSATLDVKFQQAQDSSGTGAKDVSNSSITQIVKGGSSDNKQVIVNLRPDALDIANSFNYIRLSVTVGTAASLTSALLLGGAGKYGATQNATVVQTVTP